MYLNNGGQIATNQVQVSGGTLTLNGGGQLTADQVDVLSGGRFVLKRAVTFETMHIASGGVITHAAGGSGLDLTVTGDLTIDAGGSVNANGKGYGAQSGPGAGSFGNSAAGAGHGGRGRGCGQHQHSGCRATDAVAKGRTIGGPEDPRVP